VIFKDIFLNFLIVLSPLFFYHSTFTNTTMKLKSQIIFGITCSGATILCMQLPILYGDTFLWDMRWIPFVASILYGGKISGAITGVMLLIFRYYLGGPVAWMIVFVTVLILYVTFMLLRNNYHNLRLVDKFVYGCYFALYTYLLSFGGIYIYFLYVDNILFLYQQGLSLYLLMAFSYLLTMLIFIYFTEKFMMSLKIQESSHQAEKLNLLSELAASIAHEVRNPLTVVRGFIQILRNKLDEKEREYIDISIKELDRAESIITDYLNFAKPHIDVYEEIDVSSVLDELLIIMTPYANMQEVELNKQVEKTLTVKGDVVMFKQVILNLIKNAIESIKDKEQGSVFVNANYDKGFINITITDNGIGMSSEELKRLGKPFYTTKTKGTGLGMMVTFRLVESLNGSLDIKSTVDMGTEVSFKLPACRVMNDNKLG
jgi:two-component system sporulation sensor kinase B